MVTISARPKNAPWTVVATRAGDEVLIDKIPGPHGTTTWPFQLTTVSHTTAMAKFNGTTCQQLLP